MIGLVPVIVICEETFFFFIDGGVVNFHLLLMLDIVLMLLLSMVLNRSKLLLEDFLVPKLPMLLILLMLPFKFSLEARRAGCINVCDDDPPIGESADLLPFPKSCRYNI